MASARNSESTPLLPTLSAHPYRSPPQKISRIKKALRNIVGSNIAESIASGNLDKVQKLLENGADINATFNAQTGLEIACAKGYHQTVELLLRHNASLHISSSGQSAALKEAMDAGHFNIMKLLLQHSGDEFSARFSSSTKGGPLVQACRLKSPQQAEKAVRLLLGFGAQTQKDKPDGSPLARYADFVRSDHPLYWDSEWRPLHFLCRFGHEECVKLLLNAGAEVESRSKYGITALMIACFHGHEGVAGSLLGHGADVEARPTQAVPNLTVCTPLFYAAKEGHHRVVRLLLQKKAETEARNEDGLSPLHIASEEGRDGVVRRLIRDGHADIEAKTRKGYTPLMLAASNGEERVVQVLLERGANINAISNKGKTAMSFPRKSKHEGKEEPFGFSFYVG
jgi:ankyrin repeat protein